MKKENTYHKVIVSFVFLLFTWFLAACAPDTPQPRTALDDQPARMVSAFFGLDNELPSLRWKGLDGMPVTFTKRIADPDSLMPEAFTVITRSGKRVTPDHATLRPAKEASKRHTVLLIGEFGNEPEDPPVKVGVTGSLTLSGGENAQGLSVDVTPLKNGPSLVLAYTLSPEESPFEVPPSTKQVVVVLWDGGVTPLEGVTGESHRLGYSVELSDGNIVQPIGLGDIGGDNYEYLYLDTDSTALRVNMKGELLIDPRSDANPATSVDVAGASQN